MGMLNIDEHIEEHKQIGIRYPDVGSPVYASANLSGWSIKTLWVGTQAQYDAIAVKDANTQYNIVAA